MSLWWSRRLPWAQRGPRRMTGGDDTGVLIGEHHRDVAVALPLDDVGRQAVRPPHVDDHAYPRAVPLAAGPDEQPFAHLSAHDDSPFLTAGRATYWQGSAGRDPMSGALRP